MHERAAGAVETQGGEDRARGGVMRKALGGQTFAEQDATLTPRPHVAHARGEWARAGELNHDDPPLSRLAVDFAVGPEDGAPPGALDALAGHLAAGMAGSLRMDLALKALPWSERRAAVERTFAGGSDPIVRRMVHRELPKSPGVTPEVPVATEVVACEPFDLEAETFSKSFTVTTDANPLGVRSLSLEVGTSGLSWAELDAATPAGRGLLTARRLVLRLLRNAHAASFEPIVAALGEVAGSCAAAARDWPDLAARLPALASPVLRALTGVDRPWTVEVMAINERGVGEQGIGGQVAADGDATRLTLGDGATGAVVKHALILDNSAAGEAPEGATRPGRARAAKAQLEGEGWQVDAHEGLDEAAVALVTMETLLQLVPGDALQVVVSALPGAAPDSIAAPDGGTISLALVSDVLQRARARGVSAEVVLDVPREHGAGDDAERLDQMALRARTAPPPLDPLPSDDPQTLAMVALCHEARVALMTPSREREREERIGARLYERLRREKENHGEVLLSTEQSLDRQRESLVACVERRRERRLVERASLGETSVAASSTSSQMAADHHSYTQSVIGGLAAGQRPEYALAHHETEAQAPLMTTQSDAPRQGPRRKVALVIGNAVYRRQSWLAGAERDAAEMAAMWQGQGYEVELLTDLAGPVMAAAIDDFFGAATPDDDRAFYYAGHGSTEGLLGVEDEHVPHAFVAAAAARAKLTGAKVTMIVDACQSGASATLAGQGMRGRDLLPEVHGRADDPPGAKVLVRAARELRDAYLVADPDAQRGDDLIWRLIHRLADLGVRDLGVHGASLHEAIVFAFREVEARLDELRAETRKAAWLGGAML